MNGAKFWRDTSLESEIHAFLVGSLSAISGNDSKFTLFCIDFANSLVLGHECPKFCIFWGLGMLEFQAFHGFLSEFSAWSHELK